MGEVIDIKHHWETHSFPWGSAVRERNGKWSLCFLNGKDPQHINFENLNVILHDNGIEFVK